MILSSATLLMLTLVGQPGPDSVATARRIAASAQLAAQEYRMGVVDGRVVAAAEVDEARLFLGEARRAAGDLGQIGTAILPSLDRALELVEATAPPDSIDNHVKIISNLLSDGLGITLVELPKLPPSLVRGAEIYQRECASCHGSAGAGDGPAGLGLDPAPANLADHLSLADVTPLAFYQRVTIGVAGTAMPAYETTLDPADRWAVALYATTLRQAAPAGEAPPSLRSFPRTAELNDEQILAELGPGGTREQVAAVRFHQASDDPAELAAAAFGLVRSELERTDRLARSGAHDEAMSAAFDAYLAFEGVERTVHARDAALAATLEAEFAALRVAAASPGALAQLETVNAALLAGLEEAERMIANPATTTSLMLQSFMILLREGLEAILIIGALMTFLVKVGAGHRRRDIHLGVGAAVVLSVLTAVAIETVFRISPARQELLEGITMLLAVVVLFYVSYWLLSKMEVRKWTAFVSQKVRDAVSGGSAVALPMVAFLAVYREGFETVLFYKALLVSGDSQAQSIGPVAIGAAGAALVLALVYLAISRWGVRLPLKPFFAVTSAFLYFSAFVFAGKGVAELQASGMVGTTILPGWPRWPVFGVYPTAESMLLQGVLVSLAIFAVVWIFVVKRVPHEETGDQGSEMREVVEA